MDLYFGAKRLCYKSCEGRKLAKYIATQFSHKLQLSYVYNIKDFINLIHILEHLKMNENIRLLF
jgi:hypothetical protein